MLKCIKQLIKKVLIIANVIYKGRSSGNTIALTFDDGPHDKNTEKILEVLDRYGIKATFFIVGSFATKYPELVRITVLHGHEIANHSYSHEATCYHCSEIEKTNCVITNITGVTPRLYRPPWGKIKIQQMIFILFHRMKMVLWSIDIFDYIVKDSNELIDNLKKTKIRPGDIILLHVYQKTDNNSS